MKTLCLTALLVAAAAPALAADCGAWTAGMSEEEGGPTMVASICGSDRPDDMLLITCGGEGKLGLRLVPSIAGDYPPGGNMEYQAPFVFSDGTTSAEITLQFEAMDAVMVANPNRDSDIVRLLKSKGPLTVTDKTGVLPPVTFELKGSTKAIGKVENACYS